MSLNLVNEMKNYLGSRPNNPLHKVYILKIV